MLEFGVLLEDRRRTPIAGRPGQCVVDRARGGQVLPYRDVEIEEDETDKVYNTSGVIQVSAGFISARVRGCRMRGTFGNSASAQDASSQASLQSRDDSTVISCLSLQSSKGPITRSDVLVLFPAGCLDRGGGGLCPTRSRRRNGGNGKANPRHPQR